MNPAVVYVAGVARSGSTVLERQLAARTGAVAAGELAAVWRHGTLDDRPCSCGAPFRACPFWAAVVAAVPVLGDRATAQRVDAVVRRLTTARTGLALLRPGGADRLLASVPVAWGEEVAAVYRAVAATAGTAAVVDASKAPAYALALASAGGLPVQLVHVVRDPRAVAGSWARPLDVPDGVHPPPRRPPARAALVWDAVELATRAAARRLPGPPVVPYEALVDDPDATLAATVAGLDLPTTDGPSPGPSAGTDGAGGYHSMSGNPGVRFAAAAPAVDRREPAPLGRWDRLAVDVLTAPVVLTAAAGRRSGGRRGR